MRIKHAADCAEKLAQWCMRLRLHQGLERQISQHQSHGLRL